MKKSIRAGWLAVTTLAVMLVPQAAWAHFLWVVVEPGKEQSEVRVYFGEEAGPDDPALMKGVVKAEAWHATQGGPQSVKLTLKPNDDALRGHVSAGQITGPVFLRHTYGVLTRGKDSFVLRYYAKTYTSSHPESWKTVGDAERLPLEIIPRKEGKEVVLEIRWKGKPVAGSEVVAEGPGIDKPIKAKSDAKGLVRVTLPKQALYSIRARHVEEGAGKLNGKEYKSVRNYTTLALPFVP